MCALPELRLRAALQDGTVCVLDAVSGAVTARLDGHTGELHACVWAAAGRILTASDDGTARLWDAAAGRCLHVFHSDGPICAGACCPAQAVPARMGQGVDEGRVVAAALGLANGTVQLIGRLMA